MLVVGVMSGNMGIKPGKHTAVQTAILPLIHDSTHLYQFDHTITEIYISFSYIVTKQILILIRLPIHLLSCFVSPKTQWNIIILMQTGQ